LLVSLPFRRLSLYFGCTGSSLRSFFLNCPEDARAHPWISLQNYDSIVFNTTVAALNSLVSSGIPAIREVSSRDRSGSAPSILERRQSRENLRRGPF
jgi:hypothetical protein